jgi:hypothetical protein
MPDFDSNVLLLLGISSGTYAALKITEPTKEQKEEPKQVGTDIEKEQAANSKTTQEQGATNTGKKPDPTAATDSGAQEAAPKKVAI